MYKFKLIKRKNLKLIYSYDLSLNSVNISIIGPMGQSNTNYITGLGIIIDPKQNINFLCKNLYFTFLRNLQNWCKGVLHGYTIRIRLAGIGFKSAFRNQIIATYLCTSTFWYFKCYPTLTMRSRKYRAIIVGTDKGDVFKLFRMWQSVGIPDSYTSVGVQALKETIYVKPGKQRI